MHEVHDESLDVRAIHVLVCHQHDRTIAQGFDVGVGFVLLEAHYPDDVLNLDVVENLFHAGVTHVQQLTPQWVHSKTVSSQDIN